jgi:hypothetical protein
MILIFQKDLLVLCRHLQITTLLQNYATMQPHFQVNLRIWFQSLIMSSYMLSNALWTLSYPTNQISSLFLDMEEPEKTFLWNAVITYLRARKKIVLCVASSGVASLLLLGGHTAHSRFKIPCDDLDETTTFNIKWGTMLCELIQASSLIIWDEALMTHKIAFDALDRTFRDILSSHSSENSMVPFGGKVVVLGGDLRQTLPVIEGGSHSQIINSSIVNSSLWSHVTILHLKRNMRLSAPTVTDERRMELAKFSRWMLDIEEGNIECRAKEGESEASWVQIPDEFLLKTTGDKVSCIISIVYPDLKKKIHGT